MEGEPREISKLQLLAPEIFCKIVGKLTYEEAARLALTNPALRENVFGCIRRISAREIPHLLLGGAIPQYLLESFPGVERVDGIIGVAQGRSIKPLSARLRGSVYFEVYDFSPSDLDIFRVRPLLYPLSSILLLSVGGEKREEEIAWNGNGDLTILLSPSRSNPSMQDILERVTKAVGFLTTRLIIDSESFRTSLRSDLITEIFLDNLFPVFLPSLIDWLSRPIALRILRFSKLRKNSDDSRVATGVSLLTSSGLLEESEVVQAIRSQITNLEGAAFTEIEIPSIIRMFPKVREFSLLIGSKYPVTSQGIS